MKYNFQLWKNGEFYEGHEFEANSDKEVEEYLEKIVKKWKKDPKYSTNPDNAIWSARLQPIQS